MKIYDINHLEIFVKVSDHAGNAGVQAHFPPRGGQPLPGMTALPPPPQNQGYTNVPGVNL